MFDKDPIPDGPTGNGEIDDAEFLSEEVRPADLVDVTLEISNPFVQSGGLKLRGLGVEEAEVAWHDKLVDKVDPDPCLSSLVGVGWHQAGFVLGVSIFKELEDDLRVVQGSALMRDGGD